MLWELEKVVLCRLWVFVGDLTLQAAGSFASVPEDGDADVIEAVESAWLQSP